eukprot:gb/GEZN01001260.1/.p1 GENE.gb/GEZN01001260.1/~~gb/GEZN01001260.1/.p1  ORF type:complete len:1030 (+),score=246.31 gb/GEZN01001260.1/:405-3092(+)
MSMAASNSKTLQDDKMLEKQHLEDTHKSQLKVLESHLAEAEAKLQQLEVEAKRSQDRVKDLEQLEVGAKRSQERLKDLEQAVLSLAQEKSQLLQSHAKEKAQLLVTKNQPHEEQGLGATKARVTELEVLLDKSRARVTELEALLETSRGGQAVASKENDRLQQQLEDAQSSFRALQVRWDDSQDELAKLKASSEKENLATQLGNKAGRDLEEQQRIHEKVVDNFEAKVQALQFQLSQATLSAEQYSKQADEQPTSSDTQQLTHHLRPKAVKRGGAKTNRTGSGLSFQSVSSVGSSDNTGIKLATMSEAEQRDAAASVAAARAEQTQHIEPKQPPVGGFCLPVISGGIKKKLNSTPSSATKGNARARKPPFEVPLQEEDANAIFDAMEALVDRSEETSWVLLNFKQSFQLGGTGKQFGKDGCTELCAALKDTEVQYALFNVSATVSAVPEVALLVWLGPNCKVKDKASSHPRSIDLMLFCKRYLTVKANIKIAEKELVTMEHLDGQLRGGGQVSTKQSTSAIQDEREALALSAVQRAAAASPTPQAQEQALVPDILLKGQDAITARLGSFKEGNGWVAMTLTGRKFDQLSLLGTGDTQALTSDWCDTWLQPDTHASFIMRVVSDESHGIKLTYNVLCHWLGKEVRPQVVGRVKEVLPLVTTFLTTQLGTLHSVVESRCKEDITSASIKDKLGGTRQKWDKKKTVLNTKDEKFSSFGKGQKENVGFSDEAVLLKVLRQLANDPHEKELPHLSWLLMGYRHGSTSSLEVQQTGDNSGALLMECPVPAFKKLLDPKEVQFVAFRLMRIPEQYDEVGSKMDRVGLAKPYYGLLLWHGPEISVMRKAISSHHWKFFSDKVRATMDEYGAPVTPGYCHASGLAEVDEERFLDQMSLVDHNKS